MAHNTNDKTDSLDESGMSDQVPSAAKSAIVKRPSRAKKTRTDKRNDSDAKKGSRVKRSSRGEVPNEISIYAIHARSEDLLRRLTNREGEGIDECIVVMPPSLDFFDMVYIGFAIGSLKSGVAAQVGDGIITHQIALATRPLDVELGGEGLIVLSQKSLELELRWLIAKSLIKRFDAVFTASEKAESLESLAISLADAAEHQLDVSRRCSLLANLDHRSWTLARILRRHGSDLHAMLPGAIGQLDTLVRSMTELEEDMMLLEDSDISLEVPGHGELGRLVRSELYSDLAGQVANTRTVFEDAGRHLDEAERLLSMLCDEDSQQSDRALNVVVYWLGVITLGLGLVTLWDKYLTDQAFGIPVETAATMVTVLALPMVLMFGAVAFQQGILWSGLYRSLGRVLEPSLSTVTRLREWLKVNLGLLGWRFLLRADEGWYRWVERERIILIQGLLAARDHLRIVEENGAALKALEEEIEAHLQRIWTTIETRSLVWHGREPSRGPQGSTEIMDWLWAEALIPAVCNAFWFALPRPMPANIWAALLLRARWMGLGWATNWNWLDVDDNNLPEVRTIVRETVLTTIQKAWGQTRFGPCLLSDVDLWSLLTEFEPEGLPLPPDGVGWEDALQDALRQFDEIADLLKALRPISGINVDKLQQSLQTPIT